LQSGILNLMSRFGKKPLYYYFDKNKNISFASELKAFKEDKTFSPELSYEALNCYLAIGYILAPLTIYKNIFKLEAAHYMKISDSGNKISKFRYWDYSDSFRIKNKDSDEDTCWSFS